MHFWVTEMEQNGTERNRKITLRIIGVLYESLRIINEDLLLTS